MTKDEKFVFIEQYRVPIDAKIAEPVAGLVEHEMDIEETVHKESKQESGFVANKLIFTGKTAGSAGATSETVHTYLGINADYQGKEESGELAESTITTHVLTFDELRAYLTDRAQSGQIQDSKIGHILHHALLQGVPEISALYAKLALQTYMPELASTQHDIRSHWMSNLFDKGTLHEDGSFTIDATHVAHRKKQIDTPYAQLTEEEQRRDQKQIEKMIQSL